MVRIIVAVALMALSLVADLRERALAAGLEPIPESQEAIFEMIERSDNAITPEKIALGKMLFFEPRLSKSGLISCNTCHNLGLGGTDGLPVAVGHSWRANPQGLTSPTVFNAVFHIAQFYDGRSPHLADQATGPMQSPVEMAISQEMAEARLESIPEYVTLFEQSFRGDRPAITLENIARAIEAFEATLVTPSRFDDFMHGEGRALSKREKEGLEVFIRMECVRCHNGVAIGGGSMENFPEAGEFDYAHIGSFKGDRQGRTRVPTLRNASRTAPYFHNGSVWSIEEAVRVMAKAQLGEHISRQEVELLSAFIRSLDGRLPEITLPMLPRSRADTPKPVPFE
jgi:cytochrome c peroxidase